MRVREYYTGFLMYEKQVSVWVTAGHLFEEIETEVLANTDAYADARFRLIDTLHSNVVSIEPVPFDYPAQPFKGFVVHRNTEGVELGWDFGVVFLPSYYGRLLAANKIKPVSERNWKNVPESFDKYFLLGLPGERVKPLESGVYTARPSMFSISKLHERPRAIQLPNRLDGLRYDRPETRCREHQGHERRFSSWCAEGG